MLPGSAWLLLATNVGSRLGFQLAAAGFFGWMMVLSSVWWAYGRGPVGPSASWKPVEVVVGDPASAGRNDALQGYPNGWEKLEITDPEVADATPVADAALVGRGKTFPTASDFVVVGATTKGGERYGPLGLDVRPFNVFHKPHFLAIQVQKAVHPPVEPGQPPPKAVADPQAPIVSVVMERNLGAVRRNPALVAMSCATIFGLLVYSLHTRDKEAAES